MEIADKTDFVDTLDLESPIKPNIQNSVKIRNNWTTQEIEDLFNLSSNIPKVKQLSKPSSLTSFTISPICSNSFFGVVSDRSTYLSAINLDANSIEPFHDLEVVL